MGPSAWGGPDRNLLGFGDLEVAPIIRALNSKLPQTSTIGELGDLFIDRRCYKKTLKYKGLAKWLRLMVLGSITP
jgi:hypothetical protein